MNRFIRTPLGRTLTFLLCLICASAFFGSIVAAAFFLDMNVYSQDEDQLRRDLVFRKITSLGYSLVNDIETASSYDLMTIDDSNQNIRYSVTDAEGNLFITGGGTNPNGYSTETYTLDYSVNERGIIYETVVPGTETAKYHVTFEIVDGLQYNDRLAVEGHWLHLCCSLRYGVFVIMGSSLLVGILLLVQLMSAAGRRPDSEELVPTFMTKVPLDLLVVLCLCLGGILLAICDEIGNASVQMGMLCVTGVTGLAVGIGLLMNCALRAKMGILISNNLIVKFWNRCIRLLKRMLSPLKNLKAMGRELYDHADVLYRTAFVCGGILVLDFLLCASWEGHAYKIVSFAVKVIAVPFVLYGAYELRKLQKAGKELAAGHTEFTADTNYPYFPSLREHAENLNRISEGITSAVNDRMKSERMKTELITNVSHDIKTPLTSIINYTGLIRQESAGNEKTEEYCEVLLRQSERLKRLLEDLVEASKASTGNLEVSLTPCDPNVFLSQISGEYEEKLQNAGLTLVTASTDEEMTIRADGRRMWRVFDNLMNNICKYAQRDTRVYLNLCKENGKAVFIFRNTSSAQLNISEDELMERFTRGDSSRNTEGNGLGLSIAQSLTQIQGGEMKLKIDGDLFKVILEFPLV